MRIPDRRPRPLASLALGAVLLGVSGCATLFGAGGRNCPSGADLLVYNRTGETVDVLMVQDRNEIMIGTAPNGRSVFGLPDAANSRTRFKSRRARAGPTTAPQFGGPPNPGGISFTVQCRRTS